MKRSQYFLSVLFLLLILMSSCDKAARQGSESEKSVSAPDKQEESTTPPDYVKGLFNSYGNKLNCIVSQYLIERDSAGHIQNQDSGSFELGITKLNCIFHQDSCLSDKRLETFFSNLPKFNDEIFIELVQRKNDLLSNVNSGNFINYLDSLTLRASHILKERRGYSPVWQYRLLSLQNSTIARFQMQEKSSFYGNEVEEDNSFLDKGLPWIITGLLVLILIALVYLFSQIRSQRKLTQDISNRLDSKSNDLRFVSQRIEELDSRVRQNSKPREPEKASGRTPSQQSTEPQTYTSQEINAKLEPQRIIDMKEWTALFENLRRKNKLYYLVNDEIEKFKINYEPETLNRQDFDRKLDVYLLTIQEKLRQADQKLKMDTYYSPPPSPEGYFPDDKKKPELNPDKHTYRIDVNPQAPTEATFLFLTNEQSAVNSALTNYAYELEPVCEIEGGNLQGNRIVQDQNRPGRLQLEGGKWAVTEKLRIRIE